MNKLRYPSQQSSQWFVKCRIQTRQVYYLNLLQRVRKHKHKSIYLQQLVIRKQTKIAALRWFIFFLLKGYYYGFFKYYSGDDFFQLCADMILLKTRYEHIKSFNQVKYFGLQTPPYTEVPFWKICGSKWTNTAGWQLFVPLIF